MRIAFTVVSVVHKYGRDEMTNMLFKTILVKILIVMTFFFIAVMAAAVTVEASKPASVNIEICDKIK